jgi:Family of unknown function (DUF6152)
MRPILKSLALALCFVGSLWAHHSAVSFDLSKIFTFAGTMVKVDWRNPHVEIFVEAKGSAEKIETWELETGAPSWFKGRNLAKADFEKAVGQNVTVEGVRAKNGSSYGYLYKIVFPDGASFDLR